MKIVHVADYLMPQFGYQEFLLPVWNAKHGHEVHIVTSDRYTPIESYETLWEPLIGPRIVGTGLSLIKGVQVHRLPVRFEFRLRAWIDGLEKYLEELAPDVLFVHLNENITACRCARIATKLNVPLFVDNHSVMGSLNPNFVGKFGRVCLRFLMRNLQQSAVDKFIGVSEDSCRVLEKVYGIPASKVEYLPLGVDTDMFKFSTEARSAIRAELGILEDAFVVMQTGKLDECKRPDWLAAAMEPLMRADENVYCVYVGGFSDPMRLQVQEILSECSERLKVHAPVQVDQLSSMMSAADVVVYPNATSMSAVEAASCRRSVIMADWPASIDREASGIGMCYRTGDIADLTSQISKLSSELDVREALESRSYNAVFQHYSYDAVASQSEALMLDAINERNSSV